MDYRTIKPSFARHETFGLRYSWLPKGFEALSSDGLDAFRGDNATVRLGVGKNMVSSIFYWLQAAKVIYKTYEDEIETSPFGRLVLGKHDPFLEDDGSLQLIHWKLCSNPELALAFYWFFGRYHAGNFSAEECTAAFIDFCRSKIGVKINDSSMQKDIAIVLRMYAPHKKKKESVEDQFDNPMAQLSLARFDHTTNRYSKSLSEKIDIPLDIFAYVLSDFWSELGGTNNAISLTDLLNGQECVPGPSSCFGLTQNNTIYLLELIEKKYGDLVQLKEQAGDWFLYSIKGGDGFRILMQRSLISYYQGKNE